MDIAVKYKQLSTRPFVELCNRLKYFETNNRAASHINHILGQIKKASEQVKKEYDEEIMEKFAERDENGKIKPHAELLFVPKPGTEEEFKKAQDEFLEREAQIKWKPLNPETLEGFSLSANDLELLGNLFTERVGPGLPNVANFPGPKSLSPN